MQCLRVLVDTDHDQDTDHDHSLAQPEPDQGKGFQQSNLTPKESFLWNTNSPSAAWGYCGNSARSWQQQGPVYLSRLAWATCKYPPWAPVCQPASASPSRPRGSTASPARGAGASGVPAARRSHRDGLAPTTGSVTRALYARAPFQGGQSWHHGFLEASQCPAAPSSEALCPGPGGRAAHGSSAPLQRSPEQGNGMDSGEISTSGLSRAHHGVITGPDLAGSLPPVESCHG